MPYLSLLFTHTLMLAHPFLIQTPAISFVATFTSEVAWCSSIFRKLPPRSRTPKETSLICVVVATLLCNSRFLFCALNDCSEAWMKDSGFYLLLDPIFGTNKSESTWGCIFGNSQYLTHNWHLMNVFQINIWLFEFHVSLLNIHLV